MAGSRLTGPVPLIRSVSPSEMNLSWGLERLPRKKDIAEDAGEQRAGESAVAQGRRPLGRLSWIERRPKHKSPQDRSGVCVWSVARSHGAKRRCAQQPLRAYSTLPVVVKAGAA